MSLRPIPVAGNGATGQPQEGLAIEAQEIHVPSGRYLAAYLGATKFNFKGTDRWAVTFSIVQPGDHFGVLLNLYLYYPRSGRRSTKGSQWRMAYETATERKAPRDLVRHSPEWFLSGCEFEVRVIDVKTNSHGVVRPKHLVSSKIEAILRRTAGTPPCLR